MIAAVEPTKRPKYGKVYFMSEMAHEKRHLEDGARNYTLPKDLPLIIDSLLSWGYRADGGQGCVGSRIPKFWRFFKFRIPIPTILQFQFRFRNFWNSDKSKLGGRGIANMIYAQCETHINSGKPSSHARTRKRREAGGKVVSLLLWPDTEMKSV